MLLHYNQVHRYDLMEGLGQFGLDRDPVGLSTVHFILHGLAKKGLDTTRWDTRGAGPARRIYAITEEGDRDPARWVADLRETGGVLFRFLERDDSHKEVHQ